MSPDSPAERPGSIADLPPPPPAGHADEPAFLDRRQRKDAVIGAVIAGVVLLVPFLSFIFGTLGTLVHEIGHSVVAWLLGRPAIPSFDFVHGGGWSLQGARSLPLQLAWFAGLGWLGWVFRANRRTLVVLAVVGVVWAIVAATFLQDVAIGLAGHFGELLFAGLFLYRGLTGSGCRLDVERPLSIAVGLFLNARVVAFAWGVARDAGRRAEYELGKGGVLADLHAVALDVHIHWGFAVGTRGVALLLLGAALATAPLAWLAVRHRDRWLGWLAERLER